MTVRGGARLHAVRLIAAYDGEADVGFAGAEDSPDQAGDNRVRRIYHHLMPASAHTSSTSVQDMYALYEQGESPAEIGQRFGVSPSYVVDRFQRAGRQTRSGGYDWRVEEMYALYQEGATTKEVGERFDLTLGYVGKLFKEAGLKLRSPREAAALKPKPELPVHEMHELYEQGATLAALSKQFGLSQARIGKLFKAAGLKTRTSQETAALRVGPEPPVRDMYELYEQGATLEEVGERFGVSGAYVSRCFKAGGRKVRTLSETAALRNDLPGHVKQMRSRLSQAEDQRAREMYAIYRGGATLRDVAQRFGMSVHRVGKLFRAAGLKPLSGDVGDPAAEMHELNNGEIDERRQMTDQPSPDLNAPAARLRRLRGSLASSLPTGEIEGIDAQGLCASYERLRVGVCDIAVDLDLDLREVDTRFPLTAGEVTSGFTDAGALRNVEVARTAALLLRQLTGYVDGLLEDLASDGGSPIEDLQLGARTENCLKRAGIMSIRELISWSETELAGIHELGASKINVIVEALHSLGLELRQD